MPIFRKGFLSVSANAVRGPLDCSSWNLGFSGDQPVALRGILNPVPTSRLLSVESGNRWRPTGCSPWNLRFSGEQRFALHGIGDSVASNQLLSLESGIRRRPIGCSLWDLGFGGDQSVARRGIWESVASNGYCPVTYALPGIGFDEVRSREQHKFVTDERLPFVEGAHGVVAAVGEQYSEASALRQRALQPERARSKASYRSDAGLLGRDIGGEASALREAGTHNPRRWRPVRT